MQYKNYTRREVKLPKISNKMFKVPKKDQVHFKTLLWAVSSRR